MMDRPLVFGDAEALPFRPGSFDFVICHHLLEHLVNPEKCMEEMMRVAKAGSVRVPTSLREKLESPVYHRWLIRREGGTLVFREKQAPVFDPEIKEFMKGKALAGKQYARFTNAFREDLEIQLIWKGRIQYRVERAAQAHDGLRVKPAVSEPSAPDGDPQPTGRLDGAQRLRSLASRLIRTRLGAPRVNLDLLLACPVCKLDVTRTPNGFVCGRCKVSYPVDRGAPVMLRELASPA